MGEGTRGGHSCFSQPWLNEGAGHRGERKPQRVDPSLEQLLFSFPPIPDSFGDPSLPGPSRPAAPGARAHPLQLELDLASLEHDGSPHRILHSLHLRVHGLKRKDALAPAPLGPHLEHCRGLGGRAALTTAPRARGPGSAAPPDQCRCPLHRVPAQENLDTKRKRTNMSRTVQGGHQCPNPQAQPKGPFGERSHLGSGAGCPSPGDSNPSPRYRRAKAVLQKLRPMHECNVPAAAAWPPLAASSYRARLKLAQGLGACSRISAPRARTARPPALAHPQPAGPPRACPLAPGPCSSPVRFQSRCGKWSNYKSHSAPRWPDRGPSQRRERSSDSAGGWAGSLSPALGLGSWAGAGPGALSASYEFELFAVCLEAHPSLHDPSPLSTHYRAPARRRLRDGAVLARVSSSRARRWPRPLDGSW